MKLINRFKGISIIVGAFVFSTSLLAQPVPPQDPHGPRPFPPQPGLTKEQIKVKERINKIKELEKSLLPKKGLNFHQASALKMVIESAKLANLQLSPNTQAAMLMNARRQVVGIIGEKAPSYILYLAIRSTREYAEKIYKFYVEKKMGDLSESDFSIIDRDKMLEFITLLEMFGNLGFDFENPKNEAVYKNVISSLEALHEKIKDLEIEGLDLGTKELIDSTKETYEAYKKEYEEELKRRKKEQEEQKRKDQEIRNREHVRACLPGGTPFCPEWKTSSLEFI